MKVRSFKLDTYTRYILTDVIESYEVTPDEKIKQMLAMTYKNLSIGLPGDVGRRRKLFTLKDGQYTLTYDDRVIDSFTMRIGKVDADF